MIYLPSTTRIIRHIINCRDGRVVCAIETGVTVPDFRHSTHHGIPHTAKHNICMMLVYYICHGGNQRSCAY
ncbi:MAG: hypothetical protein F4Y82_01810 [Cenarchaeum sp. SB0665_bin_23]|nr:hypothetical protein [Cenarchaeum sp. SB0667_bin_13]MXY37674.1 hypothetical protein [Cenarchaeum sp. SB0664_bin_35]MXY60838.1 hypothetical protein [Cenarchaeum sp. SB0665_bin_23]MXZ93548.1 hypothetical protein [Cenarchaeum sp. SB0666_bin_15]MYB46616.1 hypothetical protein [Cenarchaeum sp. SB0662_bin_33]MYC79892.1 hypothetical protein [Cenarchaeum sp. SB0661_bin_35]MYD58751.1 hypothetical protein [Cenarchaeum sp. SB0678_bin_8]MYG33332.1 hypothetical protein [Cenarchaeum sp. SB0677_bin_16]